MRTAHEMAELLRPIAQKLGVGISHFRDPLGIVGRDVSEASVELSRDILDEEIEFCPFDEALINFGNRTVVYGDCAASTLIHELGHAYFGVSPSSLSLKHSRFFEWEWQGWEFRVAEALDVLRQFTDENSDYGCGEEWGDRELGQLSKDEQAQYFKKKVELAQKNGTYDAGF